MKLGTETGSLVNHLYSRVAPITPEVGMGASILSWSDRQAATVVAVDGAIFAITADTAKIVSGTTYDGSAKYEFTSNPNGHRYYFRIGKDGKPEGVTKNPTTGRWLKTGNRVLLGKRDHYHDPSF